MGFADTKKEILLKLTADTSAVNKAMDELFKRYNAKGANLSDDLINAFNSALDSLSKSTGANGKLDEAFLGKFLGKNNITKLNQVRNATSLDEMEKIFGKNAKSGSTDITSFIGQLEKAADAAEMLSQILNQSQINKMTSFSSRQMETVTKRASAYAKAKNRQVTEKDINNAYDDKYELRESIDKKLKEYVVDESNQYDIMKITKRAAWNKSASDPSRKDNITKLAQYLNYGAANGGKISADDKDDLNRYLNAVEGYKSIKTDLGDKLWSHHGKTFLNLKDVSSAEDFAKVGNMYNQLLALSSIIKNFESRNAGKDSGIDASKLFSSSSDYIKNWGMSSLNFQYILEEELKKQIKANLQSQYKKDATVQRAALTDYINKTASNNAEKNATNEAKQRIATAKSNAERSVNNAKAKAESEKSANAEVYAVENAELEKQIAEKQAELAKLNEQISTANEKVTAQDYEDNQQEIERLNAEIQRLQEELANEKANEKVGDHSNDEYESLYEQNIKNEEAVTALQEENINLKAQLAEAQANVTSHTDEDYANLQTKNAENEATIKNLETENAELQSKLTQGSSTAGGSGTGTENGSVSNEVSNLHAVRDAVDEITTAVNTKTDKFDEEETKVASVASAEETALEKVRKKVKDIATAVDLKSDAFLCESNYVDIVVENEVAQLEKVGQKLDELAKKANINININNNGNVPDPPNNPGGGTGKGSTARGLTASYEAASKKTLTAHKALYSAYDKDESAEVIRLRQSELDAAKKELQEANNKLTTKELDLQKNPTATSAEELTAATEARLRVRNRNSVMNRTEQESQDVGMFFRNNAIQTFGKVQTLKTAQDYLSGEFTNVFNKISTAKGSLSNSDFVSAKGMVNSLDQLIANMQNNSTMSKIIDDSVLKKLEKAKSDVQAIADTIKSNNYSSALDKYEKLSEDIYRKKNERADYLDEHTGDTTSLQMAQEITKLEQERVTALQEILRLKQQINTQNQSDLDTDFLSKANELQQKDAENELAVSNRLATTKSVNAFWDTNGLKRNGVNQTAASTAEYLTGEIDNLLSLMKSASKSSDYGESSYSTLKTALEDIQTLVKAIKADANLSGIIDDKTLSKVEKLEDDLQSIQETVSSDKYGSQRFNDLIKNYKDAKMSGNTTEANNAKRAINVEKRLIPSEFRDTSAENSITARLKAIDDAAQEQADNMLLRLTDRHGSLTLSQGELLNLLYKDANGTATSTQKGTIAKKNNALSNLMTDLEDPRLSSYTGQIVTESGQLINAVDAYNKSLALAAQSLDEISQNSIAEKINKFESLFNVNTHGQDLIDDIIDRMNDWVTKNKIIPTYDANGELTNKSEYYSYLRYFGQLSNEAKALMYDKTARYADTESITSLASNWASWKQLNHASVLNNPEAKRLDSQISNATEMSESQLSTLSSQIDTFQSKMNDINKVGKTFIDNIKDGFKSFGTQLLSTLSIQRLISEFQQGIQITTQYNSALIEMKKVSSDTDSTIKQFASDAGSMANEIGSTSISIQNSAADWMRLGYSVKDAAELAKNTSVLMNISEFTSISEATESMVAMVQAFKDANQSTGDLSMSIIDKLNNIGNNYSISTSELAESLQRSSGTLISAGNDIDKAVALTTAANSQIQDPDKVGNALKTISMRLRGTSTTDLGGDDETTGMVTTASKLKDQIQALTKVNGSLGVSITDINGNYKDTYTILQEISDIWEDIEKADKADGQNRQAALLEDIAGKNQASVLASILQNPDMLRSVYEDVQNSEGSAMKENDEYMKSIVAHQEQLNNAYQELWNSEGLANTVNGFLDLGTTILGVVKNLGLLKTTFAAIFGIGGFTSSLNGNGIFKTAYDENGNASIKLNKNENLFAAIANYVKNGQSGTEKFINNSDYNKVLLDRFKDTSKQELSLIAASGESGYNKNVYTGIEKEAARFWSQYESADRTSESLGEHLATVNANIGQFSASTIAAKAATTVFNTALTVGISLLASFVIGLAVDAIDNWINHSENLTEAAEEAQQKIAELNNTFTETNDYVSSNKDRYDELKQGVNDLGENVTLTTEDYNEFLEINNKLADMFPSLERTYDSNGNAIVNLGNNADETKSKLDELLQAQRDLANEQIAEKLPDIYKNSIDKWSSNNSDLADYESQLEGLQDAATNTNVDVIEEAIGNLLNNQDVFTNNFDIAEQYQKILKDGFDLDSYIEPVENGYYRLRTNEYGANLEEAINKWNNSEFDKVGFVNQYLPNFNDQIDILKSAINEKEESNSEYNQELKSALSSWVQTETSYSKLDDDIKSIALDTVGKLDYNELYKENGIDTIDKLENYIKENILQVMSEDNVSSALKDITDQKSGLSDGTKSIRAYASAYSKLMSSIGDETSDAYRQFEKLYGEEAVSQLKEYNALISAVGQNAVDNLEQSDLALLTNTNGVDELYKSVLALKNKTGDFVSATSTLSRIVSSLKNINISSVIDDNLTDLKDSQTNLTSSTSSLLNAFSKQNANGFLTSDEIKVVREQLSKLGVTEKDLGEALVFTGNGMQLNTDKLNAMISSKAYEQVGKLGDQYRQLTDVYAQQKNDLDALKTSKDKDTEATKAAISAKEEEINKTYEQMASINKLRAEYQEYTDVYTKFQNALSTANQGARYDNMRSQKDTINKLAKYGQFGVDEVEAYTEYYTGIDTTNMNFSDSASAYKMAASHAKRYNTDSIVGIQNLMKDIQGDGTAHKDSDGNLVIDNIKESADKAQVSVSFLVDAINKLKEYKIDVSYDQTQFDDATKEILEQSKAEIESELEDLQVKLMMQEAQGASQTAIDSTNALIESLQEQIGEYDFEINITADDKEVWSQVLEIENKIKELMQNDPENGEGNDASHIISRYQEQIANLDKANPDLNIQATVDSDLSAFKSNLESSKETADEVDNVAQEIVNTLSGGAEFNISGNGVQSLATMKNYLKDIEGQTHIVDVEVRQRTVNADSSGNPLPTIGDSSSSDNSGGTGSVTGGIALANGTMRTQKPGETLVGELGQELVVDRSTGEWRTVGDNGAEFTNIDKGDIVFNANQTKALLSSGHINGRGKALASGQNNYDEKVIQELLDEAHENKWPGTANLTREQLIAEIDKGLSGNLNTQTRQIFLPGDDAYQTFEGAWDTIGNKNIVYSPFLQNGKGVGIADKLDEETIFWYLDQIVGMSDGTESDILRLDRIGIDDGDTHISSLISGVFDLDQGDLAEYTSEITHYVGQYFDRTGKNRYYNEWQQARADGQNNDLVGELGPEIRVHNGEWDLLGQNGAEFTNIGSSDIVIPADKTAELLSGKSYAEGKAYANSTQGEIHVGAATNLNQMAEVAAYQKKNGVYTEKNTKATKENTKATKEETKQEYNWIETLSDSIEHKRDVTSELEASSEWNSYEARISGYRKMIEYDKQELQTWNEGVKKYYTELQEKYDAIRTAFGDDTETAEHYISLIQNGSLGDDWQTAIKQAQDKANGESSDAAQKAYTKQTNAISEAQTWMSNLQTAENNQIKWLKQQHEDLKSIYDLQLEQNKALISAIDSEISEMQTQIEMKDTTGEIVTTGDYEDLIAATDDKIAEYYNQIEILQNELDELGDAEDSAEYAEIQASIADCNAQILECEKSQAEWNETIKQLPITHIESYIENIKTAQSDLNDYISELEATGQKVTADIVKQQMELEQLIAEQYKNELSKVEKNLNTYTPGSSKWNEAFTNLQSLDDEISSIVQNMIGFNKTLLQIPVDKLSDVSDEISSISTGLTAVQDDNLSVINAAIDTITRNAEELVEPLQDQLDLLNRESEVRSDILDVETAAYNLAKKMNQKTVQVVQNGKLVYQSDADDVREAQNDLQTAKDNAKKNELQREIDKINDDADDAKEKWEKIQTDTEYQTSVEEAAKLAGMSVDEFRNRVLTGNDEDLYNTTKNSYETTAEQQAAVEEISDTLSTITTLIEEINTKYLANELTADQAKAMVEQLINAGKDGLTGQEELNNRLNIEQQESADSAVQSAKDAIANTTEEYNDIVRQTVDNTTIIAEYQKKETELAQEIKNELEKAKEAYQNTVEAENTHGSYSSSSKSSSGGSSSSSDDGEWTKPYYVRNMTVNEYFDKVDSDSSSGGHSDSSNYTSSKSSSSSSSSSSSGGPGVNLHYADGIENGTISLGANTADEKFRILQDFATQGFKASEVPVIADLGEAVLNPRQQSNILSAINQSAATGMVAGASMRSVSPVVNISLGDMTLPNVTNGSEFAQTLSQTIEPTMNQYFSKFFK